MTLRVLLMLLAFASSAFAGAGQNPQLPCGAAAYVPSNGPRGSFPPYSQSQAVSLTGLGIVKCNTFELDCKMTLRQIAFDVVTSTTAIQCEPGIYLRSGTSATRLTRTGILDCSDSVVDNANGGTAIVADVLTPITLQPYTEYLSCIAFSIKNTSAVKYEAPRAIPLFVAGGVYNTFNADLPPVAGQDTEFAAKFPNACTGNGTPWLCCTANGVGATCDGIPDTLHVLTPTWTHGPVLKLLQ